MRYAFVRANSSEFPTALLCRVLRVSRSGYYDWRKRGVSAREQRRVEAAARVKKVFEASGKIYGYRKVYRELAKADAPHPSLETIRRLMAAQGLRARAKKSFVVTTDSAHDEPRAENLLNRDFHAPEPNRKWASDITYPRTREGWAYLAVILDLFSRYVVGWKLSRRIDGALACATFQRALKSRRPGQGLLHHSDRGVQYACQDYQHLLKSSGAVCSMSRKGNCWDNAPAESFFGKLKSEFVRERVFTDLAEAEKELFWYIEVFYNRQRSHATLGYLSPAQYERQAARKAA